MATGHLLVRTEISPDTAARDHSGIHASAALHLPALRIDARGVRKVDYRKILLLAAPLFVNSGVQALLNLTDTWFIGRISTAATAAMGATYFLVLVFIVLAGGIGMGVQTLVAHAYGARRRRRAASVVWAGMWASLATVPAFLALAAAGPWLLAPFALGAEIEGLALAYWVPRILGGALAVAMWVVFGFFNGIGRTAVTLVLNAGVTVLNAVLNEIFIFRLDLGIAGAGWATTASLAAGTLAGAALFASRGVHREYASRLTWRPRLSRIAGAAVFGLPMGMSVTMDLLALALFQLMQVKLGPVDGAASQIALMLTSLCFMPAVGFGMAGTTLVGQSIGAGDKAWGYRLGNATIKLSVTYMGLSGVLLAALGPWLMPWFVATADPHAGEVARLGVILLWLAAAYQAFDGLNIGASFCLRGAGDTRVPAMLVFALAWGLFMPLAHGLTFAPGQGWADLPLQAGWGASGGWIAAVVYVMALGVTLFLRWRSGAWQDIVVR
ncbi:MAG: norM [Proteobacteria bacterium]|nr:norM [Pseudomonadota bacterium]